MKVKSEPLNPDNFTHRTHSPSGSQTDLPVDQDTSTDLACLSPAANKRETLLLFLLFMLLGPDVKHNIAEKSLRC